MANRDAEPAFPLDIALSDDVGPRSQSRVTRHGAVVLAVLLMALFISNVDVAIINVALPTIRRDLHASDSALQSVVAGYTIAYAVLLITGARLGAMCGYRQVFIAGVVVFTFASICCGLAPTPAALIAARVVQGVGGAMMVPQVLTGIQATFTGEARARAIGYFAVALSIGAVAGQCLGGIIVSADLFGTSWRPIFLINAPLGLALFLAAIRYLPRDENRERDALDKPGVVWLSCSLVLLIVPLVLWRSAGWPAWTWLCLAGGTAGLLAFPRLERRVADRGGAPLLNLAAIGTPVISWALVGYGLAVMTYYALLFVLAVFLQDGLGESAFYSGLALVPWVAAYGIGGPLTTRLPPSLASKSSWGGFLILCVSYAVLAIHARGGLAYDAVLIVTLAFGGLGLGIGCTGVIRHVTTRIDPRHAAQLGGVLTTVAQTSAAIGTAAIGTLYLSIDAASGASIAFGAVATVSAFVSAIAVIAVHRATSAPAA